MTVADAVTLTARMVTCACLTVALAIAAIWGSPTEWHNPYAGNEVLAVPTVKAMHTHGGAE